MLGLRLNKANQIARRLWGIYFPKTDWRHHLKKQGVYGICVGSYRKVRRPCSCWMCGNPRRHFGARTRQELKVGLSRRITISHPLVAQASGLWTHRLEACATDCAE